MQESDQPGPSDPPESLTRVIWSRRREVLRAWLWFVGSLVIMIQVLIWARPFTDKTLTAWIASAAAFVLRIFGAEGNVRGTLVSSSLGTVEIVRECTGVYPTAMFIAAVLAYPTTWMRRLAGIVSGVLAIQVLNVIRVISLAWILKNHPHVFETAHLVVWQSLMVFLTVLIWVVWAVEFGGNRPHHAT
jgi:exosortase H (IPTLxxWG-CTERM-specific)